MRKYAYVFLGGDQGYQIIFQDDTDYTPDKWYVDRDIPPIPVEEAAAKIVKAFNS